MGTWDSALKETAEEMEEEELEAEMGVENPQGQMVGVGFGGCEQERLGWKIEDEEQKTREGRR